MMVLSMMIFGTIGLFVKKIGLPSGEIALCRAMLASVLIGLYFLISGQKIQFAAFKKELPLLVLSGAAMGMNWILLFEAYNYTTVSVATLSYYFAPVIVTLACPILFKEKMTLRQILCFAFSTLGLALITGTGDLSEGSSHLIGILFGLGAACLYALVIFLNKSIRKVGGIQRTFLQFASASAVLLIYVCFSGGFHFELLDTTGWAFLIAIGVVHSGVAYCMYFTALKDLTGQKTAILSYIDPLIAVMVSVIVLREPISMWQIFGGLLILGFTLYNEISSAKE